MPCIRPCFFSEDEKVEIVNRPFSDQSLSWLIAVNQTRQFDVKRCTKGDKWSKSFSHLCRRLNLRYLLSFLVF